MVTEGLNINKHHDTILQIDLRLLRKPCANCGTCESIIFNGFSLYDGEGVCSKACLHEHDDLGCPLNDSMYYRECSHLNGMIK